MLRILVIGLGGFVGAIARHGLNAGIDRRYGHLVATLAVNVAGCFLLGVLAGLVQRRVVTSENTRLLIQTGFLSSFTTFSTFGMASFELMRDGRTGLALLNVAVSLVLGITAAAAGWFLVRP